MTTEVMCHTYEENADLVNVIHIKQAEKDSPEEIMWQSHKLT